MLESENGLDFPNRHKGYEISLRFHNSRKTHIKILKSNLKYLSENFAITKYIFTYTSHQLYKI